MALVQQRCEFVWIPKGGDPVDYSEFVTYMTFSGSRDYPDGWVVVEFGIMIRCNKPALRYGECLIFYGDPEHHMSGAIMIMESDSEPTDDIINVSFAGPFSLASNMVDRESGDYV